MNTHRNELIDPKAAQYNGRTIKLMGDGALMEFPSVVEAVAFAVEVQLAMRERNSELPEKRQILFRVGTSQTFRSGSRRPYVGHDQHLEA